LKENLTMPVARFFPTDDEITDAAFRAAWREVRRGRRPVVDDDARHDAARDQREPLTPGEREPAGGLGTRTGRE
jgi:hypothetical protein